MKNKVSRLKYARESETRTYEINAYPEILDQLEELLKAMEYLGSIGASRTIEFYVDGDGSARPKIKRIDKDIELKKKEVDTDNDTIKGFGLC